MESGELVKVPKAVLDRLRASLSNSFVVIVAHVTANEENWGKKKRVEWKFIRDLTSLSLKVIDLFFSSLNFKKSRTKTESMTCNFNGDGQRDVISES